MTYNVPVMCHKETVNFVFTGTIVGARYRYYRPPNETSKGGEELERDMNNRVFSLNEYE